LAYDDIEPYLGNKAELSSGVRKVVKNKGGFFLATALPCPEAGETAKMFGESIQSAFRDKIDTGQYDKNDVNNFINTSDH
jgi:hypothetical protein